MVTEVCRLPGASLGTSCSRVSAAQTGVRNEAGLPGSHRGSLQDGGRLGIPTLQTRGPQEATRASLLDSGGRVRVFFLRFFFFLMWIIFESLYCICSGVASVLPLGFLALEARGSLAP